MITYAKAIARLEPIFAGGITGRGFLILLYHACPLPPRRASALGSAWWIGNITTDLVRTYLLKNDSARAMKTLDDALPRAQAPQSVAERQMVWARAQVLFAQGDPAAALALAEQLIESAPGSEPSQRIPWLLK